ncbi:ABC transporter permease [Microvirga sp. ACRRW]|uniref:ABC transporter permease n=1 Tax=Microvirga sp. ACRRW TaxID=2918205 RepID=UPI001EF66610|nr:ABC transporter permease [Microvirga sp. ACRRW]MCG7393392.1 ABC transporter permease [Microvirga sp. ACRRW]
MIFQRFFRKRINAKIGALLLSFFIIAALIGTIATPYDPVLMDIRARLKPPSSEHWFGTDQFGRDILSRLLVGARESLTISFMSVLCALGLGVTIGAASGYRGGSFDRGTMAVLDAVMAFPGLLLALGIIAVAGPGKWGVVTALGLAYTPGITRVVRSTVLSLREREFIDASRALGNSDTFTLLRHVVPNCMTPVIVMGTSLFATALLSESALAFLGLGVPPPNPTWGGMLAESKQFASTAIWIAIFPGVAISLTLLGTNLFGDALRDHLDPRMNGQ